MTSASRLKYWLQLPQGGWSASRENLRVYALLAEELGFHGVWLGDHVVIPEEYTSQYPYGDRHPVQPDRPFLEAYTTLSYIAGMTKRIRMNVTVCIVPYRHPLIHAKVAATLDYLSGGRLEIGIGTGWLREEFAALGADYENRQEVTDEYVEAMTALWSGEPVDFSGKYVSFAAVRCLPTPEQSPYPPLWVGGSSRDAFLRMERFHAGWLGPDLPVTRFLAKLKTMAEAFEAASAPFPGASAKVWVVPPDGVGDDALSISCLPAVNLELFDTLADAGTTDIRVDLSRLPTAERIHHTTAFVREMRRSGRFGDGA